MVDKFLARVLTVLVAGSVFLPGASFAEPPTHGAPAAGAADGATQTTQDPVSPANTAEQPAQVETPNAESADKEAPASQVYPAVPNQENVAIELRKRSAGVRALIAGRLEAEIDHRELFLFNLTPNEILDPATATLRLFESLRAPAAALKAWAAPGEASSSLTEGQAAQVDYTKAIVEFFSLSAKARRRAVQSHQKKHDQWLKNRAVDEDLARQLAKVKTQEKQLASLLRQELDIEIDPATLLDFDVYELLNDPNGLRLEYLTHTAKPETPIEGDTSSLSLSAQLEIARAKRDRRLGEFLSLDDAARKALIIGHALRRERLSQSQKDALVASARAEEAEKQAVSAARERQEALLASKEARTESMRLIAKERARLLGDRENLARIEAQLSAELTSGALRDEEALAWSRKVQELGDRSVLDGDKASDASKLYSQLVVDLSKTRTETDKALKSLRGDSVIPEIASIENLPPEIDHTALRKLMGEVQDEVAQLKVLERQVRWAEAEGYRDKMVSLNRARLRLLNWLSPAAADAILGFGPEGVAQAKREAQEIALEARFYAAALPKFVADKLDDPATSSMSVAWVLFKLLLVIFLFRAWRQRAPKLIDAVRQDWSRRRPVTSVTRFVLNGTVYVTRMRAPLEWLLLALAITRWVFDLRALPELEYLELMSVWGLVGWLTLRWFDAFVTRGWRRARAAKTKEGQLRYRSMRLVAMVIVVAGLIISVTKTSVGAGTIYGWVLESCWLLSIPVSILLVIWWKPFVHQRLESSANRSSLRRWVSANRTGKVAYLSAAIACLILLGDGVSRLFMSKLGGLEVSRRVMAYLFHREVAKQAESQSKASRGEPIDAEIYAALEPTRSPSLLIEGPVKEHLDCLKVTIAEGRSPLIAVVSESGGGRTCFLEQVSSHFSPDDLIRLNCRPGGYAQLLDDLRAALGGTDEPIESLLSKSGRRAIFIDDAHRIIRPQIGGLRDIDKLTAFARDSGDHLLWVMTFESPGWNYLRRARSGRAIFEEIFVLDRWSESHIGELIQGRCEAAGIEPSFESLVVPRQLDVDEDGEEESRTEVDFYRLLWDSAKGNPAVALHLWRESLFVHPENGVSVRLFVENEASDLADLPSSVYFILRGVVQLEIASELELVESTGLHPADVADAIHFARGRGFVEWVDERYRISLPWYRAVTLVLSRQHLLAA